MADEQPARHAAQREEAHLLGVGGHRQLLRPRTYPPRARARLFPLSAGLLPLRSDADVLDVGDLVVVPDDRAPLGEVGRAEEEEVLLG